MVARGAGEGKGLGRLRWEGNLTRRHGGDKQEEGFTRSREGREEIALCGIAALSCGSCLGRCWTGAHEGTKATKNVERNFSQRRGGSRDRRGFGSCGKAAFRSQDCVVRSESMMNRFAGSILCGLCGFLPLRLCEKSSCYGEAFATVART